MVLVDLIEGINAGNETALNYGVYYGSRFTRDIRGVFVGTGKVRGENFDFVLVTPEANVLGGTDKIKPELIIIFLGSGAYDSGNYQGSVTVPNITTKEEAEKVITSFLSDNDYTEFVFHIRQP